MSKEIYSLCFATDATWDLANRHEFGLERQITVTRSTCRWHFWGSAGSQEKCGYQHWKDEYWKDGKKLECRQWHYKLGLCHYPIQDNQNNLKVAQLWYKRNGQLHVLCTTAHGFARTCPAVLACWLDNNIDKQFLRHVATTIFSFHFQNEVVFHSVIQWLRVTQDTYIKQWHQSMLR